MKYSFAFLCTLLVLACNEPEKKRTASERATVLSVSEATPIGEYVVEVFEDSKKNVWFGTLEKGVARYDGTTFENFKVPISIMSMVQDAEGTLWLGGAGGLYKITKNGAVVEVTTEGPW